MNYLDPSFSPADIRQISILGLAHVGDAVYELMVRTFLLSSSHTASLDLHRSTIALVNAKAQAKAFEKISSLLTEEESAVFKRGRNAKVNQVPHNASAAEYHTATGLEALFAWLWLKGEDDRRRELFAAAYPEKPEET